MLTKDIGQAEYLQSGSCLLDRRPDGSVRPGFPWSREAQAVDGRTRWWARIHGTSRR